MRKIIPQKLYYVIAPGALTGFSCRAPENNSKINFPACNHFDSEGTRPRVMLGEPAQAPSLELKKVSSQGPRPRQGEVNEVIFRAIRHGLPHVLPMLLSHVEEHRQDAKVIDCPHPVLHPVICQCCCNMVISSKDSQARRSSASEEDVGGDHSF